MMSNRHDNMLRTDAWQHPIDEVNVGRYHISAPVAADTDGVMAATARTKTTAWVASYAQLTNSTSDTLTISAPAMMGATPNGKIKFKLATSLTDEMSVAVGTGDAADTVTITLAKTTASNNTAAKIQAAIRALGTVNEIDVSGFICVGSQDWDTQTVAKADDNAVTLANGATGDYDEIAAGLTNPPEPRTITATPSGTEGDVANVAVKVFGTDFNDEPIEEELPYFTANTTTSDTVTGSKAFKTVTKVLLPAHDGDGALTSIGFSDAFGLPYKLSHKFIKTAIDGAWETNAPTINVDTDELSKNTVQLAGVLNGEKDADIFIYL